MKVKHLSILILSILCAIFTLVGCNDASENQSPKQQITGVTFSDVTYDYDGTEKVVLIEGTLPKGVNVSYENNKKTNAGEYTAIAVLSGDNYQTLQLSATLTVRKIEISGVSVLNTQFADYDGDEHLPVVDGNIPTGVTVKYLFDDNEITGFSEIGKYNVKVVLTGNNYIEKTFNCEFEIKLNLTLLAQEVVESFGSTPEPWSFFPQSFTLQNKVLSNIPSYDNFYQVANIPTNGIGKQLSVAYDLLNKATKALSYVQPVYSTMNTIKNLYTNYIDDNPEEYKNFTASAGGFTFTIAITESQYILSATVSSIEVVIYSNVENHIYGAKIQLRDDTVLKYTVGENYLMIALDVLDTVATQIEFIREDSNVLGYMYEYIVAGDKTLTATSTLIQVDSIYTTLIGTKGDFIPTAVSRNCEVYLNSTGELVGTEVREELTISGLTSTYNTLWYTLDDIAGINSIKKLDEMNGTNADTIYINNSTDTIHTKLVGLSGGKKMASRRFDIEFKTMYFYSYNQENEEYEKISCEIPMVFIQEEQLGTFEEDFENENSKSLTQSVTINVSNADKNAINHGYYTLLQAYDIIKDKVTFQSIKDYCKA